MLVALQRCFGADSLHLVYLNSPFSNFLFLQDLVDDSYHRRAWVDPNDVPSWFVDDEKKHNQANIPMTKAMADELRQQQKEIDLRPIKKVAEAKVRMCCQETENAKFGRLARRCGRSAPSRS